MLLYLRYLILRAVAACLGFGWSVPPWPVAEARADGGTLRITYLLLTPSGRCDCAQCRAERGEVNGTEVGARHGEGEP